VLTFTELAGCNVKFAVYAFWLVLPPLQAALAYRLWGRKFYRQYPVFFAYTLEQLIRFATLFYLYQKNLEYAYDQSFAALQTIEAALQIGIICELFSDVLQPYKGVRRFGPPILRGASIFFLFLAILAAVFSSKPDSYVFLSRLFLMARSVEIVQGGLLLILLLTSLVLALQWKPQTLGIAVGFGLFTMVNLITYSIHSRLGIPANNILSLVSNAAYDVAVVLWIRTFFTEVKSAPPPESSNWDPTSWNESLTEVLRR
jgi:hypothetical protein